MREGQHTQSSARGITKLLPWEWHRVSQPQATMALNYISEHLRFITSIYFVHLLTRCILRELLPYFTSFWLTEMFHRKVLLSDSRGNLYLNKARKKPKQERFGRAHWHNTQVSQLLRKCETQNSFPLQNSPIHFLIIINIHESLDMVWDVLRASCLQKERGSCSSIWRKSNSNSCLGREVETVERSKKSIDYLPFLKSSYPGILGKLIRISILIFDSLIFRYLW